MNQRLKHYVWLADIFDYPNQDFVQKLKAASDFLNQYSPAAAFEFEPFVKVMTNLDLLGQQELFIRSFDVQALTTLDLGYVLFGDDYKRGELLVNLNREHRTADNDCGNELADYLPNVLRLLPKLLDESLQLEFVEKILGPALRNMINAFDKDSIDKKEKFYQKKYKTILERPIDQYTIYRNPLLVLHMLLQQDFNFHIPELSEKTSDFLKNIGTEILLEDEK